MKRSILLFIAISIGITVLAQDDFRTIFGDGNIKKIRGFGGPLMTFTTIDGEFAHMMGGGGAVLLGDFWFGGYGEGLTNAIPAGSTGTRIDFGHGGFWTGYSFFAARSLHPTISSQIGWGTVGEREYNAPGYNTDNVFVFNPGIELEIKF